MIVKIHQVKQKGANAPFTLYHLTDCMTNDFNLVVIQKCAEILRCA